MGPGGLNYRVRDGNGCDPSGMIAGKLLKSSRQLTANSNDQPGRPTVGCKLSAAHRIVWRPNSSRRGDCRSPLLLLTVNCKLSTVNGCIQQIYGQAERAIRTGKLNALLRLHTRPIYAVVFRGPSKGLRASSTRTRALGRSNLGACFPLRCFQRLSLPDFATQPCHGRDSWYTRGLFIPVLSY